MISLFSGALGLDLGLERAGFRIAAAVESNRWASATIASNRPDTKLLAKRIEDVPTQHILESTGLGVGDAAVVSAGPSCQTFSTVGQRRSLSDPRGTLFRHFCRVVKEAQPRFFIMENVRGVLSAAIRHRPLAQRGPGYPTLEPEEQHGSAFQLILRELSLLGYYVVFALVDAADYGVAQHRQRLLFIGSRDGEDVRVPEATHGASGSGLPATWRTLRQALAELKDPEPIVLPLAEKRRELLAQIPAGGNWRDLPKAAQEEALGKAYHSWGGRTGFYRRLAWERPAPALTTNPTSKATMAGHPDEVRVLTVAEYARLQGFPDDWTFAGGPSDQYVQIGNAVPVGVGRAVGIPLMNLLTSTKQADPERKGVIACRDAVLLERINKRPRTVLNPQRMRQDGSLSSARAWMAGLGGSRRPPVTLPDGSITDEATSGSGGCGG